MSSRTNTTVGRLLLAAAAFAAVPMATARPDDAQKTVHGDAITTAERLLAEGQLIRARQSLESLMPMLRANQLGEPERERALNLLATVDRKIRTADRADMSLQKAEVALEAGDVRTAERHASAVSRSSTAAPSQRTRASRLMEDIAARKAALAPMAPALVVQAQAEFDSGRYAEAKASIDAVFRSGAELGEDDRLTVNRLQDRILEIEAAQGRLFETGRASAAILQPGVVKRKKETPPPACAS